MNRDQRKLIEFIMRLPSRLKVEVHRTPSGGYWAKVLNLPGCVTQAGSFTELIEMVNDAVQTYFEIPARFSRHIGLYVPNEVKEFMEQQERRGQIDDAVREIMRGNIKRLNFSRSGTT